MCQTAIRKSFRDIPRNEQLRRRLDDAFTSLKICLECIWLEKVFASISEALIEELVLLNDLLTSLEKKYDGSLPLKSEEPVKMQWKTDCNCIDSYRNKFEKHKNTNNEAIVDRLIGELDIAYTKLENIERLTEDEFTPTQYVNYFLNELQYYSLGGWNSVKRILNNKLSVAPPSRKKGKKKIELETALAELKEFSEFSINTEKTMIYYEGLGRHLWNIWHPLDSDGADDKTAKDANHLLELTKKIEYYVSGTDVGVVFVEREVLYEEEFDCDVDDKIKNNAGIVALRLGFCHKLFVKGFSTDFVLKMMNELLKSRHKDMAISKLKDLRGVCKFIYQLAGVFIKKEFLSQSNQEKIIAAVRSLDDFGKAKDKTLFEYMRKKFNDAKDMQEWIEEYIDEHPFART